MGPGEGLKCRNLGYEPLWYELLLHGADMAHALMRLRHV